MKLKSNKSRTFLLLSTNKELSQFKQKTTKINSISMDEYIKKYDSIEISLVNEIETFTNQPHFKYSGQLLSRISCCFDDYFKDPLFCGELANEIFDIKRTICSYKKLYSSDSTNIIGFNTPLSLLSTDESLTLSKKQKTKKAFLYLKQLSMKLTNRIQLRKKGSFSRTKVTNSTPKFIQERRKNKTKTVMPKKISLFFSENKSMN